MTQQTNGSMSQRVALVTGGSTGIGAAVALALARAGAQVVITGRHQEALRASASRHPQITHLVADVARSEDARRSIADVRTRFGRLDVLVNNAGIFEIRPLADAAPDHVQRLWETNVLGLIETTRAALPLIEAVRGSIVNIASIVADQPFANASVYSATKAAVLALTRAWAQELAERGVRVNAVSPGPIETPIFGADKLGPGVADELGPAIRQMVPLKRFGTPEEVARVVAFLASPDTTFVTGAQYTVGGGMEA